MAKWDKAQRDKAADRGEAMPDGSFPIKTNRDLESAVRLYKSGHQGSDPAAVRRHILRRAKALGVEIDLAAIHWSVVDLAAKEYQSGGGGGYSGPSQVSARMGSSADGPRVTERTTGGVTEQRGRGAGKPYARHAGEDVQCPKCHRYNEDDAKFCDQCGAKLPEREVGLSHHGLDYRQVLVDLSNESAIGVAQWLGIDAPDGGGGGQGRDCPYPQDQR